MRKLVKVAAVCAIVCVSALPNAAVADSAASGWNSNKGFSSPSEEANAFNRAQAIYLLKRGVTPGSPTIVNNNMTCEVAGSCQQGGTAQNINGFSNVNVDGEDNNITVDVDAEADQTAVSTSATGDFDIGDINF